MMLRTFRGFSLIELMVVVAVVGVLTGLSFLFYQNYVARSQVGRVMSEVGHLRVTVEGCIANGLIDAGGAGGECSIGLYTSNLVGSFTSTLDSPISLRAVLGGNAATPLHGLYLTWSRNASGGWTCHSDVAERYLPVGCTTE